MEAIRSDISNFLFFLLFFVQQGSADEELNTIFGGATLSDDALLYLAIAIFIACVLSLIFALAVLYKAFQVVKIKHSRQHSAPAEMDKWQGDVDDIIQQAYQMPPIPRATSMSAKSHHHNGYDNRGARTKDEKRQSSDESSEDSEPRGEYTEVKQGGRKHGHKFP